MVEIQMGQPISKTVDAVWCHLRTRIEEHCIMSRHCCSFPVVRIRTSHCMIHHIEGKHVVPVDTGRIDDSARFWIFKAFWQSFQEESGLSVLRNCHKENMRAVCFVLSFDLYVSARDTARHRNHSFYFKDTDFCPLPRVRVAPVHDNVLRQNTVVPF